MASQPRVIAAKNVLFEEVEGEAICLNLENGKYYGLDSVGTRVWLLLLECGYVEHAYQVLLTEYDVSADRLWQDLCDLLDDLVSHGLLQIVES